MGCPMTLASFGIAAVDFVVPPTPRRRVCRGSPSAPLDRELVADRLFLGRVLAWEVQVA